MPDQAKTRPAVSKRAYQLLPIIGPSAGVDLRTSPTLLPADRARTLINFSLEEPGALVVRPGYVAFSSQLGTGRMQGGQRVYLNSAIPSPTSTMVTVMAWNQGLYLLTDSGGFVGPTLTGMSTTEIFFPSDRDLVAALDGSTRVMKSTNGSSWTRFGVLGPTVAPTLSSLSTGGLSSGEFEIGYTYKDRDLAVESNGSTAHSTLTLSGTSGAINVIVPNSTDPQVDAIVVYARKVSAAETIRRKVSSFAQSAGVNSTVIITSSNWTTNDEEPSDHDVPASLSFGVVWKNRWWARDSQRTNRIHFTQIFQPQSWPALFYIDIPFERGDAINALLPLGDALLIFGTTKIFVIIGQTSLDFEVRPTIGSEDGALGPRSVAALENGVVHVGGTGIYIFDGTSDKLLSFDLDPAWQDLVDNTAVGDLEKIPAVYHHLRKELRVAVPRRYPSGTWGEWVLDLNRSRGGQPAWTATDRTIGGYMNWDGPEHLQGNRGRLFSWHSSVARVFEEAVGTSANSSNLTAEYEGPGLTLGALRGRWTDLRGEYEPHAGTFSEECLVDGVSQGTQAVSIGAGLATYGTAVYGTSKYGGSGRRQFVKMRPLSAEGRTYVQRFTYAGQERFRLYSYHIGIQPETRSRDFSE